MNQEEQNYLDLVKHILENGNNKSDRTGIGTKSIFGAQLRFSLENGKIPLITTKKIFIKGVIEELLFFIRGERDTKKLESKGVNIWKGNTSREFLDKRGLSHYKEGDMGPMYGVLWRNFGQKSSCCHCDFDGCQDGNGIDQLSNCLELIKTDPDSRRIIVTAHDPTVTKDSVLYCCHNYFQFYVNDGKLSCHFLMRSNDLILGAGFNFASYAILTHLMAKASGLKTGELIYSVGDVHVYNNTVEGVKLQLSREPYPFPTLKINKEISSIKDMESLEFSDFEIENYIHHPAIKMEMAI